MVGHPMAYYHLRQNLPIFKAKRSFALRSFCHPNFQHWVHTSIIQPCVQTIVMPRLSVYKFKADKNEIQLYFKKNVTRLQVQLSSIGMLVSSLLNMHNPCSNTHNASNCPRTPQVPKTAESYPLSHVQDLHPTKAIPNCEQTRPPERRTYGTGHI